MYLNRLLFDIVQYFFNTNISFNKKTERKPKKTFEISHLEFN